ncbi:tyrosine-type recombinase/integrase [Sphingomonas sp. KR1UV-12]|uniref:Tyrosine-type recombinase/integrase n=1 Tax=Sphingomonas aurea TaxID=3063994 RepID=A0ABT9EHQ7_9SPHN|nr:tyrosine-type recombinase/integrase [Sphingomonas sp. KR1UV-12]MDP1026362.1 tyrosine-type recombinase/integrase [Sphingomonas sp. KR1UV-12]
MKTRYPHVTLDPDRHGKVRARFRKNGRKVYMKALPDQPGFEAEYKALMNAQPRVAVLPAVPRSVSDLCARFYLSGDFAGRGNDETRGRRRGLIEAFRAEFGAQLVADFQFEHIEAILIGRTEKRKLDSGRSVGGEVAARNLRKELLRLFAYARKLKWIATNPVEEAERIGRARLTGFHPWTEAEIAQYKARHPLGTRARLALEIMLWTGQRRGDTRLFGPAHIIRGKINFRASKNGADLWLPIAPDLRRAIDAMPHIGLKSFLVTQSGVPFSKDGFGNKVREWCNEAGLPQCTAHGLRKAIARRMAESQVTQLGIKAVGGWKGDSEVTLYTAAAEQESLASVAMGQAIGRFSDS